MGSSVKPDILAPIFSMQAWCVQCARELRAEYSAVTWIFLCSAKCEAAYISVQSLNGRDTQLSNDETWLAVPWEKVVRCWIDSSENIWVPEAYEA